MVGRNADGGRDDRGAEEAQPAVRGLRHDHRCDQSEARESMYSKPVGSGKRTDPSDGDLARDHSER